MKCYYHPTVEAVAICKFCGRALCRDCIAEVGLSCSCRGRCEADVAVLNELMERGRTAYQKTSASYFRTGVFIAMLGAIFAFTGLSVVLHGKEPVGGGLLSFLGLVFIAWGVSHFISARKFKQK